MTKFSEWPGWLQVLVVFPHSLLGFIATVFWWPRSKLDRRRFWFVAAYLFVVYLVLRFIFDAR